MSASALRIDAKRLLSQIDELAAINRQADGSCCRIALSDADRLGRDLVVSWMRQAKLRVSIDQIGNIIGIREGTESGDPVMTGSHIDTVATGGAYDGAYGVLAGLEAVRTLDENGIALKRSIAVVVFTNEEGVRYQPDMMGSLVYAGGLSLEEALAAVAEDGSVLGDELARIGYAGSIQCGSINPNAFVELHIEQGPVLEKEGLSLGVVTSLQGISWQKISVIGTSNHAGTTPMRMRNDAGLCAAKIAVFVRDLADRMGGSQVGTVGTINLKPNLINVIASESSLAVDLRNTDDDALANAKAELSSYLEDLEKSEGVFIDTHSVAQSPGVEFDQGIVSIIETVCNELGEGSALQMVSGAGHDAQMMARICPSGMIFVPSTGGVSHNPKEFTPPDQLELGANVLMHTLLRIASV